METRTTQHEKKATEVITALTMIIEKYVKNVNMPFSEAAQIVEQVQIAQKLRSDIWKQPG